jgi:hypothetical protein
MEESAKSRVCTSIYRQFPEVRGSNPSVTSLPAGKYQLIFHGKAQTADGKTIERTVRVAADEKGNVLKLTTSR